MPRDQLGIFLVDHVGQVAAVIEDHVELLAVRERSSVCSMHQSNSSAFSPFQAKTGDAGLRRWPPPRGPASRKYCTAPGDLGAEFDERFDEHGGLDGHVQAAGDLRALERLLALRTRRATP